MVIFRTFAAGVEEVADNARGLVHVNTWSKILETLTTKGSSYINDSERRGSARLGRIFLSSALFNNVFLFTIIFEDWNPMFLVDCQVGRLKLLQFAQIHLRNEH